MAYSFYALSHVYLLKSQSEPDLYKFGHTTKDPFIRLTQLNREKYAGISDWELIDFVPTFKTRQEHHFRKNIKQLSCDLPGRSEKELLRVSTDSEMKLLQLSLLKLKLDAVAQIRTLTDLRSFLESSLHEIANSKANQI